MTLPPKGRILPDPRSPVFRKPRAKKADTVIAQDAADTAFVNHEAHTKPVARAFRADGPIFVQTNPKSAAAHDMEPGVAEVVENVTRPHPLVGKPMGEV